MTQEMFIDHFYVHESVHRESVSIDVQRNATIYSLLFFCIDCSTCFGLYLHPSSGAHITVNYNIWHRSDCICYRPLTLAESSRYSLTSAKCCNLQLFVLLMMGGDTTRNM